MQAEHQLICWTSLLRHNFWAWLQDGGHEEFGGNAMVNSVSTRTIANLGIATTVALFLAACGSYSLPSLSSSPSTAPEPGEAPEMPASIRADEIVGRWGLASYQNPADRART